MQVMHNLKLYKEFIVSVLIFCLCVCVNENMSLQDSHLTLYVAVSGLIHTAKQRKEKHQCFEFFTCSTCKNKR